MKHEDKVVATAASAHLLTHAYMMIFPTVLVLIARDTILGVDRYFLLGSIAGICYALFGLGAIPAGLLADKYGSKKMLVICMFASGISSIGAGLSFSVYLLIASMACLGLAASIYHPSGLSFIARNVEKKGRAMGFHGVGGNLGLAAGQAISGAVAAIWGWRSAFLLFGAFGIALAMVISRLDIIEGCDLKKVKPKPQGREMALAGLVLCIVYGTTALYGLCYRGTMMFLPKLFVQNIDFALNNVARAGLLVSIISLAGTVGQYFGGSICDKLKKPEFVNLFLFLFVTPLFFAIFILKDWSLFRICLVFAPFFFAWQPIQNTLIAKYASYGTQGASFGVNFTLLMGVGSLAASFGGYITDALEVTYVFAALGCISFIALALVFYILRLLHLSN